MKCKVQPVAELGWKALHYVYGDVWSILDNWAMTQQILIDSYQVTEI